MKAQLALQAKKKDFYHNFLTEEIKTIMHSWGSMMHFDDRNLRIIIHVRYNMKFVG